MLPSVSVEATGESCVLCIAEIQTASAEDESEEYIIVANGSSVTQSLSSVQLQYLNSNGILDNKVNLSGSLLPGQTKAFVSAALKPYSPSATLLPFTIFSGGGSLQLFKQLTATSVLYDQVGWGDALLYETAPLASIPGIRNRFVRAVGAADGSVQDSGDNSSDFLLKSESCEGAELSEIQPFVTDASGKAIEAWVELNILAPSTADCYIATSVPTAYQIPKALLAGPASHVALFGLQDPILGTTYFRFPAPDGSVALAGRSEYGGENPVFLPSEAVLYSDLQKGQSVAKLEEYGAMTWKATYALTPNEENGLLEAPVIIPSGSPTACEHLQLSELLPNPAGADDGYEWIEVHNTSSVVEELSQCFLSVENETYWFGDDARIGPGEFRRYDRMLDENGAEKTIALRNSDETVVALSRAYGSESTLLQSVAYQNAPEGRSYARFEEGWGWTYQLTPSSENILQLTPPPKPVTDTALPLVLKSTATSTSKTTTKKSTASTTKTKGATTKAATAKSTLGTATTAPNTPEQAATATPASNPYLFVGFGALAVLYAGYEYRSDLAGHYRKWRRNRRAGGSDRQ